MTQLTQNSPTNTYTKICVSGNRSSGNCTMQRTGVFGFKEDILRADPTAQDTAIPDDSTQMSVRSVHIQLPVNHVSFHHGRSIIIRAPHIK